MKKAIGFHVSSIWIDVITTITALSLAFVFHRLSFIAGYQVIPTLVPVENARFLILIVATGVICLRLVRYSQGKERLFRCFLLATCLMPFFLPGFRDAQNLRGFEARVKRDIRPDDLVVWLQTFRETNSVSFVYRKLTVDEFADVVPTNSILTRPDILASAQRAEMELLWGSPMGGWIINYNPNRESNSTFDWEQGLSFHNYMK